MINAKRLSSHFPPAFALISGGLNTNLVDYSFEATCKSKHRLTAFSYQFDGSRPRRTANLGTMGITGMMPIPEQLTVSWIDLDAHLQYSLKIPVRSFVKNEQLENKTLVIEISDNEISLLIKEILPTFKITRKVIFARDLVDLHPTSIP